MNAPASSAVLYGKSTRKRRWYRPERFSKLKIVSTKGLFEEEDKVEVLFWDGSVQIMPGQRVAALNLPRVSVREHISADPQVDNVDVVFSDNSIVTMSGPQFALFQFRLVEHKRFWMSKKTDRPGEFVEWPI